MCIKIRIIKIEIKRIRIYTANVSGYIPQTLASNLKAEFTLLANTLAVAN
jgi:hypothetical protein